MEQRLTKMLIRIPQAWKIPEGQATSESVYLNRRQILAAMGLPTILPAANRNPQFTLDRPLTEEWAATSYNNYYEFSTNKQEIRSLAKGFKPRPWTVEIAGACAKPQVWSIEDLEAKMPIEERLYRHRCVEAWAMAVPWMGFPLAELIRRAEPQAGAKYVRFISVNRPSEMPGIRYSGNYPWPYYEGLRMDEAMNPLAFLVTGIYGKPLPNQNGAPLRLALPWKYGFKSIKAIVRIELVSQQPETFWNKAVPNEYGFYANVNPKRPHPRWSQAVEQLIPNMERVATQPYNGYEKWVGGMYKGSEI
jgi:sulfoxide reductase catalytic subunit YedY